MTSPELDARLPVPAVLADEIASLGVARCFGLLGEDLLELTARLQTRGVSYVGARHENVAIAMADGYAWATGEVAVALVTRGPGLTNALTAARTASNAKRRLLILTCDGATATDPAGDLKYVDPLPLATAAGLAFFRPASAAEVVPAFRAATASTYGRATALLAIPIDLMAARCERPALPAEPPAPPAHSAPEPTCEAVGRIADLLAASTRPLILVGRGATIPDGRPLIGELAERIGALIGTTLLAKDAFRGHRYNLGVVGGFASDAASTLLADVDCVLALGASLNDFTTADGTLFADVPVIHIDADRAVLGRNFSAALPVVADARSTVVSLLARLPERGADSKPFHRPAVIDALVGPLYRGLDESSDGELDVRVVVAILDELLPDDRVVVLDGGRFMAAPGRYVHVPGPDAFRLTADFGSIGVGLGVAMGAAVAGRGDPTVLFVGDGGLSAVLGDLATAAKENLALLVVVMNDSCWGQERTTARAKELPLEICDLADVDFAGVAAALGIEAATVRTVAELRKLAPRFAGRASPLLLDCKISRDIAAAQLRWPLDPMAAELPPLC